MPEYIISEKQLNFFIKNFSNENNQVEEVQLHELENNDEKLSEIDLKDSPLKSIVSTLFK